MPDEWHVSPWLFPVPEFTQIVEVAETVMLLSGTFNYLDSKR